MTTDVNQRQARNRGPLIPINYGFRFSEIEPHMNLHVRSLKIFNDSPGGYLL